MSTPQPLIADSQGRRFARSAVAVQVIVVDADEHVRLPSALTRNHPCARQVIGGRLKGEKRVRGWCLMLADKLQHESVPDFRLLPMGCVPGFRHGRELAMGDMRQEQPHQRWR